MGAAGTVPAGLIFGGDTPPNTAQTESFNGTNWTEVGDLNTARARLGGTGTQTSALAFGGSPPVTGITEAWNGTNWTEVADLNTARFFVGSSKQDADNTTALCFGGETPPPVSVTNTELWNGTNWTETTDMAQKRAYVGGSGTSTAALAFGGTIPPFTAATEEWTGAGAGVTRTFTDS